MSQELLDQIEKLTASQDAAGLVGMRDHADKKVRKAARKAIHNLRAKGVEIKTRCAVESLLLDAGRVTGVETAQGALHAPLVVSAIGPWTRDLTGAAGIDIALEVSRHIVLKPGRNWAGRNTPRLGRVVTGKPKS